MLGKNEAVADTVDYQTKIEQFAANHEYPELGEKVKELYAAIKAEMKAELTDKIADEKLVTIIRENFDLRPAGIIKMLDLRRPIYKQTSAYGHFGRNDLNLPWEALDKVEDLKKYL